MIPPTASPGSASLPVTPPWREAAGFLALTFGFAWLLWGYWVVAMPPGGLVISPLFLSCAIGGGLAPSLAALVVSAFGGGRPRVLALLATIGRPAALRHLLMALVTVPSVTIVSVAVQSLAGLQLRWPDPSLLAMAFVWPVMAALGEEFGWRAFLLPRLASALGLIPAAVTIGLLWGVWHLPADYIGLKGYGDLFWLAFLINGPLVLTAHSLIMTWLWRRTNGSTLVAVLYHWSITASAIVAPGAAAQGWDGIVSAAIGAGLVWLVAAALIATPDGLRAVPDAARASSK